VSEHILYTYKAPKQRELSDEERAKGITEPIPPHHPGVPFRDLTAEDVEAMPPWLQDTVAASELYEATPEGKRRHKKAREPEPAVVESSKPKPEKEQP
jgi:hypothetical protein